MKRFCTQGLFVVAMLTLWASSVQAESSVWVVQGGKTVVYLAGSCHVLRASDHPLPTEFETAYARVRRVIFELPMGEMDSAEYAQKLMAIAVYADGSTLKEHLKPAVYAKAEKFCRERQHPFEQYQSFRPWMLSMMLVMRELSKIGVEPQNGIDRFFYWKALKDGKFVGGLETMDDQIGFLNLLDRHMGNEQVSATVDDLRTLEDKMAGILEAWRKGDEDAIEAFNRDAMKDYPLLYQSLILDRNKKWAAKIARLASSGAPAMVITGVAHLAGTNSVVDLLRKRGYQVVKLNL